MSDIFISYASEDRELAKQMAQVLTAQGWSVWWDREIPLGKPFDTVIRENLDAARCVIVLWTRHSIESNWVRAEASSAEDRGSLIPVLMDQVEIPLGFRMLQAADLSDWQPTLSHIEFDRLIANIHYRLDAFPLQSTQSEHRLKSQQGTASEERMTGKGSKKALLIFGWLVLPNLTMGGLIWWLMHWWTPTQVQIELIVDRLTLTLEQPESILLFDQAPSFRSITLENFAQLRFAPQKLELINVPTSIAKVERHRIEQKLSAADEIVFTGEKSRLSQIRFEMLDDSGIKAGRLEPMMVQPGTEIIINTASTAGSHELTLQVLSESEVSAPFASTLLLVNWFKLVALQVALHYPEVAKAPIHPLQMRVKLREDDQLIRLMSEPNTFTFTFTSANDQPIAFFTQQTTFIRTVEFFKQNGKGERQTSLLDSATITYIDYPSIPSKTIDATHFLQLAELDSMHIKRLYYDPVRNGLVLMLLGKANRIQSSFSSVRQDHRLTQFERLWHDTRLVILFSIACWFTTLIIGVYKIVRKGKPYQ